MSPDDLDEEDGSPHQQQRTRSAGDATSRASSRASEASLREFARRKCNTARRRFRVSFSSLLFFLKKKGSISATGDAEQRARQAEQKLKIMAEQFERKQHQYFDATSKLRDHVKRLQEETLNLKSQAGRSLFSRRKKVPTESLDDTMRLAQVWTGIQPLILIDSCVSFFSFSALPLLPLLLACVARNTPICCAPSCCPWKLRLAT